MNSLPWIVLAALAAPVVIGRITRTPLGVPHPPFVGAIDLHADPLLIVSVCCFAAAVLWAPRLLTVPPAAFAAAAFAMTLVLRLALAAGGGGRGGAGIAAWWKVFDPARSYEAPNEYLPALGALHWGPRFFLDRFAETVPALPVHAAGHPPGMLLTLYALGISSPGGMAALCIGVGALSVPLALSGRPPVARRAARARRDAAARVRAGSADLRRDVSRRRLSHARPARGVAAHRARVAAAGRRDARRGFAVLVVAAGGRRVGGDRRLAA